MIDFTQKYNRGAWQSFLKDSFLSDDFKSDEKEISFSETLVHTQSVTKLGESACLGLTVFEITHKSINDARVGLSKEAFRLVCNYTLHSRALVLFVPQNNGCAPNNADDFYRFSLVEFTPIVGDDGKVMRDYSNPRRYSFLLGREAKVKTPQQYLVQKGRVKDAADLRMRFSVEVLNREFYANLVEWYDNALDDIQLDLTQASKILNKKIDDELKPQAVIRVIIRLLFMWFMKEKGLIDKTFFTQDFKTAYLKNENTYYNAVLQNLFFAVLNKKIGERRFRKQDSSNRYDPQKNDYGICDVFRFKDFFKDGKADSFLELTRKIPFVNGGLFTCHDYKFSGIDTATNKRNVEQNYIIDGFSDNPKDRAKISDEVIFELIELFTTYAFTIEENTPSDVVVALDPELLGTVFENLIGTYNPETKESARKATGSFYTPREIVDYMCKESLKVALASKLPHLREQIADIIESSEDHFDFPERNDLVAAITSLKILDPACGSGAFPMGMFTLMVKTVEKLQERKTTYKNKLDIITNCIYGVDIQNIAIEISKLRFFISLLVDYEVPAKIEDFEVLPNLETKFTAANTLIGIKLSGGNLFNDQLLEHCKELTNIFTPFTKARTPKEKETIKIPAAERRGIFVLPESCTSGLIPSVTPQSGGVLNPTARIKNAFAAKKQELVKLLVDNNIAGSEVEKVSAWNPFNVCYTSPFFDSAIMFGVAEGFDVVVGNPPYGADYPNDQKNYFKTNYESAKTIRHKQKGSLDTFTLFIEKGHTLCKLNGNLHFIVPIAITSSDSMTGLHQLLENSCEKIQVSSYAVRPQPVFQNAVVNTSILFFTRTNSVCKHILATKMYRKNNQFNLQHLVSHLEFVDVLDVKLIGRYPKISLEIEKQILKKLFKLETAVGNMFVENGTPIFYRFAGGRYYKVVTNYSTGSSAERIVIFDKKYANTIGAILSSNLFFWFYQIYSDNLNLKAYELESFRIPIEKLDGTGITTLETLYIQYLADIERNANIRQTTQYTNIDSFKEYKIGKSKHLIDQIDDVICPLYGLTTTETEFIKQYEIEFRLGEENG
ncbi:MAG: hypothetical protein Ta2B_27650 [Termitinemataceae bacterium]|nr:MAG: hypothetical protein Ta2B_27650 [Termitinemataceae bacterium]